MQPIRVMRSSPTGPPPPTPRRYWRLLITANDGSPDYCGMTELQLRGVAGGSDLTTPVDAGGRSSASTSVNSENGPDGAFNDDLSTGWLSSTSGSSWIKWDFGAGGTPSQWIAQIVVTGSWNAPAASPKNFQLQWSDNNSTWATVLTVAGQTGWTGGSDSRTFNVP